MIDVMKRLAELDSTNPNVVKEEKAEVKETPVQLSESVQFKKLAGVPLTESEILECGIPGMGAEMPHMPATINMSAASASEIVTMMRGIVDLAKTDAPSDAMAMAVSDELPGIPGADDALVPGHAEPVDALAVDEPGVDLPGSSDDEVMDLIKKIHTGQPVKVTTDMPVKVSTDKDIKGSTTDKHTSSDNGSEEDEGFRGYDNSPHEQKKDYNPNDFAQVVNKVRDFDYTPAPGASNPMPDQEEKEKEKDESINFEAQLFAEYKKFVSESKEKGVSESETQHIPIGQQMANDGITYSREKEGEIIDLMVQYMKKDGMSPKSIRYYINYDEDYVPDQLSYLPRAKKSGADSRLDNK